LLGELAALHSRPFFSPDETSCTQVAREILETRDFVVPTIDGTPWLEKPPLVYWLLAVAYEIFRLGFPAVPSVTSRTVRPGRRLLPVARISPTGPDSPERPHSVTRR
jgi:hypothetical protein